MQQNTPRLLVALISLMASVVLITILNFIYSEATGISIAADLLLGNHTHKLMPPYPFTIQNLMWLMFGLGCGELFICMKKSNLEIEQTKKQFLPEDDSTMLRANDLGEIYQRINTDKVTKFCYLQRLISRSILQFQGSRSVSQSATILDSSLELFQHEIDLSYTIIRYITWLIPTLGFIGTVVGIALSLHDAGVGLAIKSPPDPQVLVAMTGSLGIAFYTTLLALILSAILVLIMNIVQERQETSLNHSAQYCLDNLINRLYEK